MRFLLFCVLLLVTPLSLAQPHVQGRILVKELPGKHVEAGEDLVAEGGVVVDEIKGTGIKIVQLPPKANAKAVAARLKALQRFEIAEPDWIFAPSFTPDDPYFPSSWHHPKMRTPEAWDLSKGAGVVIAICDSGAIPHPDLNLTPGTNVFDGSSDTLDTQGHGTAVAGTAAAVMNNALGVAGVAGMATIMPIKATDALGYSYASKLAQCITYAADQGVKVANASFGPGVCGNATVGAAADYMASKGGVVTVSAGNNGAEILDTPRDSIICVGATDSNDKKTSWSSYGAAVDVVAPGTGIWTTTVNGAYGQFAGTSAAAPVVAGVAALVIGRNGSLTAQDVRSAIFATAVPIATYGTGFGRVDAAAAVAYGGGTPPPPPDPPPPPPPDPPPPPPPPPVDITPPVVTIHAPKQDENVSGIVAVIATGEDNVGVVNVTLYIDNVEVANVDAPGVSYSWNTCPFDFNAKGKGLQKQYAKKCVGWSTITAIARDAAGNAGSASVSVYRH